MLVGTIRSATRQELTVEGRTLVEVKETLAALTPEGWELLHAPVTMAANSEVMACTAVIGERVVTREIEAEDMERLRAAVPEGYSLLSVRRM